MWQSPSHTSDLGRSMVAPVRSERFVLSVEPFGGMLWVGDLRCSCMLGRCVEPCTILGPALGRGLALQSQARPLLITDCDGSITKGIAYSLPHALCMYILAGLHT